jgi:hypothetical protein
MSQVEIVRKDGTKLGVIDELKGTIEMEEVWEKQPRRKAKAQPETQKPEEEEEVGD